MAATTNARVGNLEGQFRDLTGRVDQVRRAMGFNGKIEDPEVEADIAAGFREMRLLAKQRRELESVEQAKATLKAHYANRLPTWVVWSAAQLRRRVVWAVAAVAAGAVWGFGNQLSSDAGLFLQSHHLFGH
jgi:hypothetical protein